MVNIRALKTRIGSIQNIQQITRAMEMVSTTKLRRFQSQAEATDPYAREIRALTAHLAASPSAREGQPLFSPGTGEKHGYLFITSDRGLCGAYNTNILNLLKETLATNGGEPAVYLIGKKGLGLLAKLGIKPQAYIDEPPLEKVDFRAAQTLAQTLLADFLNGVFTDLTLVYTAFISMAKYEPRAELLLPVDPSTLDCSGPEAADHGDVDYILEPGQREILATLLPKYLEVQVFNAMIQSLTSEYASRRVSMKNATDAAGDMKEDLTRTYNRARQETITKELLDIVGAAEALR